ncbi:hypothetical protein J2S43_000258 [Catenuloplanes nepalensis]|uniref:DUF3592 domain-containing protein n=1 Tax=Catenuloplanes nepalensis TaxID=587533 RepID=A0ABT9MK97_9ACTN|nr:DUF3592 domain-containing protein [Catenuloplanes nepalensis]MDP9791746.1 hypothetical protein [Catenuloplanes nepalensis]
MPIPLVVLISLLAVAAVVAATAVVRYRAATVLLRTGRRVPGEIIETQRVRRDDGPDAFSPVVRFRTVTDHEVIARPGRWQTASAVSGSRLTVVYDESRPTRIAVDGAGFVATDTRALMRLGVQFAAAAAIAAVATAVFIAIR